MPKIVDIQARREELAAAAARRIAEVGIEATRLRDVAADAGWSTGVVTHYFSDKSELMRMAMLSSFDQLRCKHIAAVEVGDDELLELLKQALPLQELHRQNWKVTLTFYVQSWADDESMVLIQKNLRAWRRRIVNLVIDGMETGRFRSDLDAEEAVDEIITTVEGIAIQALYDPERWPPDKQRSMLQRRIEALTP